MTKKKKILLGVKARNKQIEGADFLADALQVTLGPFGQNWSIEKGDKITNDGRNIAVEMEHPDEIAHRGLNHLRKASIQTEQEVKDASTSTVVLGRAILKEAVKNLPSETVVVGKMTTAQVIKQIEKERLEVTEKLDAMAQPITSLDQLIEVANVSTENEELAKLIATAQWELGKDGILIAEEHIGKDCKVEVVRGLLLDNGLANTQVITNQEKQALEVSDCRVILTNNTVEDLKPLAFLISNLAKSGVNCIVLMARAFTPDAIKQCMKYTESGFAIFPVNAPYVDQVEIMKDLQAVHGGNFINIESKSLSDIEESDVGFAENIVVERYRSTFVGLNNEETKSRVEQRIAELRERLKGNVSDFDKENLEKRIAQLSTGFAVIKIGAATELTRKRLKDKADDAVGTVRIALEEGVVKGGGLALKEIAETLDDSYILKGPIQVINKQIMSTAPKDFIIEDWVKDPVKTIKVALKYACEAASNIATIGGAIATAHDKPRYVQEANTPEEEDESM